MFIIKKKRIKIKVFFWMVIGEKEFQDQKVPTPEPELRY